MGESGEQNSSISASCAARQPVSKRDGASDVRSRRARVAGSPLVAELARLAEMAEVERNLRDFGFRTIAGTDEVGRGCLAGPVVAAAVILSSDAVFGLNDSKLVPASERGALCSRVLASSMAWAVGVVQAETIDRINILEASRVAMHIAVESLAVRPDVLLVDAVTIDELHLPQLPMIAGDRRSVSIAAASIVAKVYRDSLMESYHDVYPQYGFSRNRGYGTESHWEALRKFGPTPLHRLSFDGVAGSTTLF